jgi:tetratricopeptide (TPR) repeat protein
MRVCISRWLALLGAAMLIGAAPVWLPAASPPLAPEVKPEIPDDPFAGLAERFRLMAQRDEASKDWQRALMRWEAVAAIDSKDRESRQRISAIRRLLKETGDRHFALAKEALKQKQYAKAFREFLRTLSYDSDNEMALTMVKHELNAKSINEYTVQRGDTLREIAQSQYDDPELTYLVQYYNDIARPRDLKIGQVLKLPVVAGIEFAQAAAPLAAAAKPAPAPAAVAKAEPKAAPKPEPKTEAKAEPKPEAPPPAVAKVEAPQSAGAAIVAAEVRQTPQAEPEYSAAKSESRYEAAKRLFDAKQYDKSAAAAEAVLDEDPANGDARELVNASYYEQGKALRDKQQNVAALQVLTRVDPGYKDVGTLMTSLQGSLSGQEAEVHYIAGVTAFLQEDLDTAIKEWEQTLQIDPKHPQAGKDLENARALQAKLATVK